jgi:glyoxylase-like metal-dependent hydrolase (beta-lactamase superfamily II)
MDHRIISIGALESHPFWGPGGRGEAGVVRSGHSTCTLVRSVSEGVPRLILVDPGVPGPVIRARLHERAGLRPEDVTHVFLTCFRPETLRGIEVFDHAVWWISGGEREGVGVPLVTALRRAMDEGESELVEALQRDVAMLQRCEAAPDTLADRVDLFPMPGVTPGMCGLLLEDPRHTTLICGDAVLSEEHLERGQVAPWSADVKRAKESFAEAVEIADLLVPGRDNVMVNPVKRPF